MPDAPSFFNADTLRPGQIPAVTLESTAEDGTKETLTITGTAGTHGVGPMKVKWRKRTAGLPWGAFSAWLSSPLVGVDITRHALRVVEVEAVSRDNGVCDLDCNELESETRSLNVQPKLPSLTEGGVLDTDTVDTPQIVTDAVTGDELATGAVDTVHIAAGAITSVTLGDASVTTAKLADGSVATAKIDDAAVTTVKVGDSQITTLKIGDLQITTEKLNDLAVNGDKLAVGAVIAGKIAAGIIVAGDIAALTITAGIIAAGAITADKINVADLSAIHADLGTVTAGTIDVNVIIRAEQLLASKIGMGPDASPDATATVSLVHFREDSADATLFINAGRFTPQANDLRQVGTKIRPKMAMNSKTGVVFERSVIGDPSFVDLSGDPGTLLAGYGLRIFGFVSSGTNITTQWGLKIEDIDWGVTRIAIQTGEGAVIFGDSVTVGGLMESSLAGDSFALPFETATATNPVFTFGGDLNTGIGRSGSDKLSLIAGAKEGIRITESGGAITIINLNGPVITTGKALIGTAVAATGDPQLDVVGDAAKAVILISSSSGDGSNKDGAFGIRHLTNAEEPVAGIIMRSESGNNYLRFGGGTHQGQNRFNAATIIQFYTAANGTTLTGTLLADMTGVGVTSNFRLRGSFQVDVNVIVTGLTTIGGLLTLSSTVLMTAVQDQFKFTDGDDILWMRKDANGHAFAVYNSTGGGFLFTVSDAGAVFVKTDLEIDGALNHDGSTAGFYGTTPQSKQIVSGSRSVGIAALTNLLNALDLIGLITDSSSA